VLTNGSCSGGFILTLRGGLADILLANFEDSPALSGKLAIAVMNSLPDARGFFLFK
jgi:hypothetical protein